MSVMIARCVICRRPATNDTTCGAEVCVTRAVLYRERAEQWAQWKKPAPDIVAKRQPKGHAKRSAPQSVERKPKKVVKRRVKPARSAKKNVTTSCQLSGCFAKTDPMGSN